MKKELSTCVIQKFNGYELLRNHLNSKERKDFIPIDVAYEPSLNENKPIWCYYPPKIYLGFHTTVEKSRKGQKILNHTGARQCHYCNNFFVKNDEKMKKFICLTFSFDNGKIIDYQDHYKNLCDLPFPVYYDFETTTGSVVFLMQKCMW